MKAEKYDSLITLLRKHHSLLRRQIRHLSNESIPFSRKRAKLQNFLVHLQIHSRAEEETLYYRMRWIEAHRNATLTALEEHHLAAALAGELQSMDPWEYWDEELHAKVLALAKLVARHISEEEEKYLPKIRKELTLAERKELAQAYHEGYQRHFREHEKTKKGARKSRFSARSPTPPKELNP